MCRPNLHSVAFCVLLLFLLQEKVILAQDASECDTNEDGACVQNVTEAEDKKTKLLSFDPLHSADQASETGDDDANQCGVYFATSTIPGAGLGMFAGKSITKYAPIMPSGDIVIPVVDIQLHHDEGGWTFLWDEYTCKFRFFFLCAHFPRVLAYAAISYDRGCFFFVDGS